MRRLPPMPSAYTLIRSLLRLALELYYVDIQVVGGDGIPADGPLIVAANHPNSLMDTVLLGTQTPRRIHYLARSGLFERRLGGWLLSAMGALPIHRAEDHAAVDEPGGGRPSNEATFAAVLDLLSQGGCVGIFPEGRNSPLGQVGELKTGLARMAFAAEARHDFELGLRVVPVGIHFERRDRWFTGVLLRVGRPIIVADHRERWLSDPRDAVRHLTGELQRAIRQEALHIEDTRRGALVQALSRVLGQQLIDELLVRLDVPRTSIRKRFFDELRNTPHTGRDLDDEFQVRQLIGDVVDHTAATDSASLDELERRVRLYSDHVEQVRLRHDALLDTDLARLSARKESVRLTAYAVVFLPLALWGLLHNTLPWLAVRRLSERVSDEAVKAITIFAAGLVCFPLFYALQGWALWRFTPFALPAIAVYVLTLPLAGFFWLRYKSRLLRFRQRVLARTLFRNKRELIVGLAAERRQLLTLFRGLVERSGVSLPGEAGATRLDDSADPVG